MRGPYFRWGIGVLAVGCTTTTYSVDRVLADARRDESALSQKLGSDAVGLQGKVTEKGAVSAGAVHALGGELAVAVDGESRGYVVLEGTTSEPGRVLCLFEERPLERLSPVSAGELVSLSCLFDRVVSAPPDRVVVFDECYVE